MNILICEYAPGRAKAFKQWLPKAHIISRYLGEKIQEPFDAIIFGGGPMSSSIKDQNKFPFLKEDLNLIRKIARKKNPPLILGICLGAQLITRALGGKVIVGKPVRGWNHIQINKKFPHSPIKENGVQFEFHSNHIVTLPKNAVILASSKQDRVEAYCIGTQVFAVTYHPEVTPIDAKRIYKNSQIEKHEYHNMSFDSPGPLAKQTSKFFFQTLFSKRKS